MDSIESVFSFITGYFSVTYKYEALVLLVLCGGAAHLALRFTLKRVRRVAINSAHNWDDVLIKAIDKPLIFGLWILIAYIALTLYPQAPEVQENLQRASDTGLVVLLAWVGYRLISGVEKEFLALRGTSVTSADRAAIRATATLARIALSVVLGLMVLQTLGVSISGLLAKDMLANFFGGLSIHLDRPFTVGDWVRSPDKEIEGTVESIGWRLTCIRTFDQRPLYVPNSTFSQISVENPSRMFNRRIYETIGLRYEDADCMAAIVIQVRDMLKNHEDIDTRRTLIVNFVSFGPSTLDFFIYVFTKTTVWVDFHQIKEEILLKILNIIHANGADVAFPTQTLQLEQIAQIEQTPPEASF